MLVLRLLVILHVQNDNVHRMDNQRHCQIAIYNKHQQHVSLIVTNLLHHFHREQNDIYLRIDSFDL